MKKVIIYSIAILFSLASCNKEIQNTDNNINKGITGKQKSFAANFSFNWETATTMPVSPASVIQPSMPWQSQSGSYIDPNILTDYKSSDGRVLVYNTFNNTVIPYPPTVPTGGLYFTLYNIYRGLLRFYVYIPSGYINNNADIQHGLSVYSTNGSTTKMLNFEGVDIVDANANLNAITKTNNNGIAYGGGWYSMQYEIAYDPNFANTTFPTLGLTWSSQTVTVSTIKLDGTQVGTITGNITQQSSGFNWTSVLSNGISGAAEIYGASGLSAITGKDNTNLNTALQNGLAGSFTGLFSGLFGGDSNNSQAVDLKMNTVISLSGTITTGQPFLQNSLVVPGQNVANTIGSPIPLYNSPLGVFNLIARPTVYCHTTEADFNLIGDKPYKGSYDVFTIDPNLLNQIVYNPIVTKNATINVIKEDLLVYPKSSSSYYDSYHPGGLFGGNGIKEQVGNLTIIRNPTYLEQMVNPIYGWVGDTYIRLTIQVTPNNGSPKSNIVKTFLANVVQK